MLKLAKIKQSCEAINFDSGSAKDSNKINYENDKDKAYDQECIISVMDKLAECKSLFKKILDSQYPNDVYETVQIICTLYKIDPDEVDK